MMRDTLPLIIPPSVVKGVSTLLRRPPSRSGYRPSGRLRSLPVRARRRGAAAPVGPRLFGGAEQGLGAAVGERAGLADAAHADDEPRAARDAREHLAQRLFVERRVRDAVRAKLAAQARDRVRAPVVDVRVDVERAALYDERVVVDVELQWLFERGDERVLARLRARNLLRRDGQRARRDDLLREVVQVRAKHPHAAVRDEVAEVAHALRLMNQVAVAERNLHLAERVARVARLDDLAGRHALVPLHPVARRRNPRRVPDYLARLPLADVDRVLLHPDADVVRLNFLPVLPQRQAE